MEVRQRLHPLPDRRGKLLERHLRWEHKWREQVKSGIYYDLLQKGFFKDKPDELEPDITGFQFYFDAFNELSTSRQIGLSLGPISFTAIAEYFRIYELSDFDEFSYLIRRMDGVFLELESAGKPAASKNQGGGTSGATNSNKTNTNQGRHVRRKGPPRTR